MKLAKITREITSERIILPGLAERIAELHREIDALVERFVEDARTPGVPASVIRQCLLGKARGCKCAEAKLIAQTTKTN